MFPKINPTTTSAWKLLQQHYEEMQNVQMKDLFKEDTNRFAKYSLAVPDISFDYSKNIVTDETLRLLTDLANECRLKEAIEAMFNGEKINITEDRAVLHIRRDKIVWFPRVDGNNGVFREKPSLIAHINAGGRSTDMKNQMPFAMRMHVEGTV